MRLVIVKLSASGIIMSAAASSMARSTTADLSFK